MVCVLMNPCGDQIIEKDPLQPNGPPQTSLTEIGPRFVLTPIRIFEGAFSGATVYSNPGTALLTFFAQVAHMTCCCRVRHACSNTLGHAQGEGGQVWQSEARTGGAWDAEGAQEERGGRPGCDKGVRIGAVHYSCSMHRSPVAFPDLYDLH